MNDPITLLKQLINCRSVTPEHGGALDIAQECLSAAGFSVWRMPAGNVDNLWAINGDAPKLIFAGHVDVVPAGDLALWECEPFCATEKESFIYGRGATDMKSGVAAMLCAACELRDIHGIGIILTSDEEGPAIDGVRYVVEWMKQNNHHARYVIVGEPTSICEFGDTIKIGRRGSLTAHIKIHGIQSHVAYPHRGDNPNHRLTAALNTLRAQFLPSESSAVDSDGFPPTGAQVVAMQSGVGAENVIPALASAVVNFRYAPTDGCERLKQILEQCLQEAAPDKWQCEWINSAQPFMTGKDGALVQALQDSIFSVCGRRAEFSADGGTSDGRFLRDICDEIAEFGVVNATMHAHNERVEINQVQMLAEVYRRTAQKLLAQ